MAKDKSGKFTFTTHTPTDETDVGFKLLGYKLRWLGARHQERGGDRIWMQLRKSDLSDELLEHLSRRVPQWLSHGDMIRKGGEHGSVLAYASMEAVENHRRKLDLAARQLQQTISRKPPKMDSVKVQYEQTQEKMSVPSQFKKSLDD